MSTSRGTSWAYASDESHVGGSARNLLRYGLAILWIVDGILQAQPEMFTTDFYANYPNNVMESVLQSVADGQPGWLSGLVHFGMWVWGFHPILFNVLAIAIQVGIGLALVIRGSKKVEQAGLWASVLWGLVVWVFGEGMGGILSGSGYLDGWPGAVLLYVLSSIVLLLPEDVWSSGRVQQIFRWGFAVFWTGAAILQLSPSTGLWLRDDMMSQFANPATLPQPQFLSAPIQQFSLWSADHAVLVNLALGCIMLYLAVGYVVFIQRKWFMWTAMVWLCWTWWFGQDFGGLFSGIATDFNSIAVLILWTVVVWNVNRTQQN